MLIGDTTGSQVQVEKMVGAIDETRIFSTALSRQVSSLYTGQVQSSGQLPAATPLTVAAGATLDLNSQSQAAASLAQQRRRDQQRHGRRHVDAGAGRGHIRHLQRRDPGTARQIPSAL